MTRLKQFFFHRLSVKFGLVTFFLALLTTVGIASAVLVALQQQTTRQLLTLAVDQQLLSQELKALALETHYVEATDGEALLTLVDTYNENLGQLRANSAGGAVATAIMDLSNSWDRIDKEVIALGEDPSDATALASILAENEPLVGNADALRATIISSSDQFNSLLLRFAPVLAVLALITFGILVLIIRRVMQQIRNITAVFRDIEAANYATRAAPVAQDELGSMATSLNSMLDKTLVLVQSESEKDRLQAAIMTLLDEVSSVADGDLTIEADVTADVTGAIADSFNYMIHQLRDIISNVQHTTLHVRTSANELRTRTHSLALQSQTQAQRLANKSVEIASMAEAIKSVSQTATESAAVGVYAQRSAQQGNEAVKNTIAGMSRIRGQVQETAKRIKRLGESSQEIGEIVQLISDIADRTSILALNASIQAAMAGETGKGFAIVAQEVEQLAERAAESTREIDSLVKSIQVETTEAVAAMEATTAEVVKGSDLANQAGSALVDIESVSSELANLIETISASSQSQAQESDALATSMTEISALIQQNAIGTEETATAIDNVATLAEELRNSLNAFKLPAPSLNGAAA